PAVEPRQDHRRRLRGRPRFVRGVGAVQALDRIQEAMVEQIPESRDADAELDQVGAHWASVSRAWSRWTVRVAGHWQQVCTTCPSGRTIQIGPRYACQQCEWFMTFPR